MLAASFYTLPLQFAHVRVGCPKSNDDMQLLGLIKH